jgi:hypothetical protein
MEMTDTQLIQSVIKMQEELVSALAEVSRLTTDIAKSQEVYSSVVKRSFASSDEEKGQVMRFLFNLQKSGITNMMAADEFIQKRFGFTKVKCQDYLFEFIDNYTELEAIYMKPKALVDTSVVVAASKKRKGPKPYSEMTPEELAEAKAKKAIRDAAKPADDETAVSEPSVSGVKKTILKVKKIKSEEPKPKGVLIWNAFMNTVKAEMMQADGTVEPSYNDIMKKAQEMKEADPESYKLFSENWTP